MATLLPSESQRQNRGPWPWLRVTLLAGLFLGSIGSLAWCLYAIVDRDSRKDRARLKLEEISLKLASAGETPLASVPSWPQADISEASWKRLDESLAAVSSGIVRRYPGVTLGLYSKYGKRFLGASSRLEDKPVENEIALSHRPAGGPPPSEYELIEMRVHASVRKKTALYTLVDSPPNLLAMLTLPVWRNDEVIGAVWAIEPIDASGPLNNFAKGYLVYAACSLAGIALSIGLLLGLASTVRAQAAEKAKLERELRRNETLAAMGKLLAGVAHEVRNPLAGIRTTAQLWQRGVELGPEGPVGLINEVDRLESIVSRLLDFVRVGKHDLVSGDLGEILQETARCSEQEANNAKVRIELNLATDLPRAMMAPNAILQVTRNLASNAIQVTPPGGSIRLSTHVNAKTGAVEAAVEDDGPGLQGRIRDRIFEPFFTTKPEGVGLGLAISREIALAHRGELKAENRRGRRGAVFTLTLPIGHNGQHTDNIEGRAE